MKETITTYTVSIGTAIMGACNIQAIDGIINIILGLISTIIVTGYTLYKWYLLKVKSDGKLDASDIEEGLQILEDLKDNVEEVFKDERDVR